MRALLHMAGWLLPLSVWAGAPPSGPPAAAAQSSVPGKRLTAVWRAQHLDFVYAHRTSRYSCDGLRDKVRAILLEMGARRDLTIAAVGCGSKNPGLRLEFYSPALPDAALQPPHAQDPGALQARFENFVLTNDAFRNFSSADCELVEEFTRQVLPKLTTRGLEQDIACVSYQATGSRYVVRGEILRTVPRADQATGDRDAAAAP